jgi:hypothetical protein
VPHGIDLHRFDCFRNLLYRKLFMGATWVIHKMPKPILTARTIRQRNMLVDHIDGPVDMTLTDPRVIQGRNTLIDQGLLQTSPPQAARPRITILTELGRMALAAILAEYADALVRAGFMEPQTASEGLKRLQSNNEQLFERQRDPGFHTVYVRRSVE